MIPEGALKLTIDGPSHCVNIPQHQTSSFSTVLTDGCAMVYFGVDCSGDDISSVSAEGSGITSLDFGQKGDTLILFLV